MRAMKMKKNRRGRNNIVSERKSWNEEKVVMKWDECNHGMIEVDHGTE